MNRRIFIPDFRDCDGYRVHLWRRVGKNCRENANVPTQTPVPTSVSARIGPGHETWRRDHHWYISRRTVAVENQRACGIVYVYARRRALMLMRQVARSASRRIAILSSGASICDDSHVAHRDEHEHRAGITRAAQARHPPSTVDMLGPRPQ